MGLDVRQTCLLGFTINIGADQPAHPRSLVSTFVIHFLKITIARLSMGKISSFLLVSVAEETGFSLPLLETPKKRFLASRP